VPDALGRELPRVKGEEEGRGGDIGDEETNESFRVLLSKTNYHMID
jgi:hypothetical protein